MLFILLIGVPMIIGIWAQMKVSGTYKKYSDVAAKSGITGREAAAYILRRFDIHDVEIVPTEGLLTDHYDPMHKRLVLSKKNYFGNSLAALGVAAHEAGHAVQHKVGYRALKMRMALVPITQFSSQMLPFVIIGGLVFKMTGLIYLGILVYLILTIFQLVTLPVEFDASKRALAWMERTGVAASIDQGRARNALHWAAMTYVVAALSSLAWLGYYLFQLLGMNEE